MHVKIDRLAEEVTEEARAEAAALCFDRDRALAAAKNVLFLPNALTIYIHCI